MNERIRELAEEHGFIHEYMTIGERNDALTKYKEFAELIVGECAELCDRFQERDVGMQPAECAGAIRQMFGVKE